MELKDLKTKNRIVTNGPFLKWVGSKQWLKEEITHLVKKSKKFNYFEPFLGSGAVFFNNNFKSAMLNDINKDLVITYKVVRDMHEKLIDSIKKIPQNEDSFYQVRMKKPETHLNIATRFVYLNKTSFNGLYRVNSKGEFNASYGKREFSIPALSDRLRYCAKKLKEVKLFNEDFTFMKQFVDSNSIVFFDPPYLNTANTGFNKYDKCAFSQADNQKLIEFILHVKKVGGKYILTNEDNPLVRDVFSEIGDHFITATRKSKISSKIEARKTYNELIVTNITL